MAQNFPYYIFAKYIHWNAKNYSTKKLGVLLLNNENIQENVSLTKLGIFSRCRCTFIFSESWFMCNKE